MLYRVFGRSGTEVTPAELLEHLHSAGERVTGNFRGDDLGWTSGELSLPSGGSPLVIERYLCDADEIRQELNTWAAWLETADYSPNNTVLMERVIQTKQLFALRRPIDHPDEAALERVCDAVSKLLAARTDGVYQIDDKGFFDENGGVLLEEY